MISAFLDMSMGPNTNIIYLWRDRDILSNPRDTPNHFQANKTFFGNLDIAEIKVFGHFGKARHRQFMISSNHEMAIFEKLQYDVNIFRKKHGRHIWYCGLNIFQQTLNVFEPLKL